MLARAPRPSSGRPAGSRPRRPGARGAVLALHETIGNRAVAALLQRSPSDPDVIREVAEKDPADWASPQGRETALLAEVAALAQVDRVLTGKDGNEGRVTAVRRTVVGERAIMPGLNFSAAAPHGHPGETGFVDQPGGAYRGLELPVALDGELPGIAIILGPSAFTKGKVAALAIVRHEMEHARHAQRLRARLERWRSEAVRQGVKPSQARTSYDAFKDPRSTSAIDAAMAADERSKDTVNTEVLAYVEGFMTIFHLQPAVTTVSSGAVIPDLPHAIWELAGAARRHGGAARAVRDEADRRLRAYVDAVLSADQRRSLQVWIAFILARWSARQPPASTGGDRDGQARNRVWDAFFSSNVDARPFLEKLLEATSRRGGSRR